MCISHIKKIDGVLWCCSKRTRQEFKMHGFGEALLCPLELPRFDRRTAIKSCGPKVTQTFREINPNWIKSDGYLLQRNGGKGKRSRGLIWLKMTGACTEIYAADCRARCVALNSLVRRTLFRAEHKTKLSTRPNNFPRVTNTLYIHWLMYLMPCLYGGRSCQCTACMHIQRLCSVLPYRIKYCVAASH